MTFKFNVRWNLLVPSSHARLPRQQSWHPNLQKATIAMKKSTMDHLAGLCWSRATPWVLDVWDSCYSRRLTPHPTRLHTNPTFSHGYPTKLLDAVRTRKMSVLHETNDNTFIFYFMLYFRKQKFLGNHKGSQLFQSNCWWSFSETLKKREKFYTNSSTFHVSEKLARFQK